MSTATQPTAPVFFVRTASSTPRFSPRVIAALLVMALAFGPMLVAHFKLLWSKPHYEFFPLVYVGAALLFWVNSKRLGTLQAGTYPGIAYALACMSFGLLFFAMMYDSAIFGITAFLIALQAFIYHYGGWLLVKRMFPAWLFLLVAVPPPRGLDRDLIIWLQKVTAKWSSVILDLFGVLHSMSGNVVQVPGKDLMVEEACSGIHSLFATLVFSLFLILWSKRSWLHGILLILGGVGWVLVGNLARVVAIAYCQVNLSPPVDLTTGWKHDALGFVIFGILMLLVLSTDRFLLFLLSSLSALSLWRRASAKTKIIEAQLEIMTRAKDLGKTRWPAPDKTWITSSPAFLGFGLIALANLSLIGLGAFETTPLSAELLKDAFAQLDENYLPAQYRGWQRIGFETQTRKAGDINGDFSRVWRYRLGDIAAVISLDYAWTTWHDLQVCYVATGWTINERIERTFPIPGREIPDHMIELRMTKVPNRHGYQMFTVYDADGLALEMPDESLAKRLRRISFLKVREKKPLVYQVQLMTETNSELSEAQRERCKELFNHCRQLISRRAPRYQGN
jgi:exosortase